MKRIFTLALTLAAFFVAGCDKKSGSEADGKKLTVGFMPKSKGNAYFVACKQGADVAAKELGVELIFDGPTETDPAKQNEIVETWITRGVDVLAVACENREGISTALKKAQDKGIKVVTYDSDSNPDARAKLESILHPRISRLWEAQLGEWRAEGRAVVAVVIPLLFETKAESAFDSVICLACSTATQHARLASRGWSPDQIAQRIAAQLSVTEKMSRSSHVVWTEGDVAVTAIQMERIIPR